MSETEKRTLIGRLAARKDFWLAGGIVILLDQLSKLVAQFTLGAYWETGRDAIEIIPGVLGLT